MESCQCGAQRRKFWLWRDQAGHLHASAFEPSNGTERVVYAATVRDALLAATRTRQPKHTVTDADNPLESWEGRCSADAAVPVAAL